MMIVQIFDFLKTIDLHILKERIYGMWTMSQESCYKNKQNKNFSALNHPENVGMNEANSVERAFHNYDKVLMNIVLSLYQVVL